MLFFIGGRGLLLKLEFRRFIWFGGVLFLFLVIAGSAVRYGVVYVYVYRYIFA
jgi:hypothetical protein